MPSASSTHLKLEASSLRGESAPHIKYPPSLLTKASPLPLLTSRNFLYIRASFPLTCNLCSDLQGFLSTLGFQCVSFLLTRPSFRDSISGRVVWSLTSCCLSSVCRTCSIDSFECNNTVYRQWKHCPCYIGIELVSEEWMNEWDIMKAVVFL